MTEQTETTEPEASAARKRVARRQKAIAIAITTAVLCAAGGGTAFALAQASGPSYRTATAGLGTVAESLDLTGTVASVTRRDMAFQVSGTVASVAVSVGEHVAAGQTLAALDTDSLQDAIDSAQDAVDSANDQLESDLEAQASGETSSTSSGSGSAGSGEAGSTVPSGDAPTGGASSGGASSGGSGSPDTGSPGSGDSGSAVPDTDAIETAVAAVQAAQQTLLTRYQSATDAYDVAEQTVASSDETCRPFLEATLAGEDVDADADGDGAVDGGSSTADPSSGGSASGEDLATLQAQLTACQAAIRSVQTDQESVSTAQQAVLDAASALDSAVSDLRAAATAAASATSDPDSTAETTSAASNSLRVATLASVVTSAVAADGDVAVTGSDSASGSSAPSAGGSATITADTILSDQAAVDSAEAQLAIAQADLVFATLSSPIDGTVAAVSITAGGTVSAGSTDAVITVVGDDGYAVSSTVTLTNVAKLEVGQTATVELPSSGTTVSGTVSAIGLLDTSDSSTPSYDVTIALDDAGHALVNGTSASVAVAVAAGDSVLTVPTSAVHRSGTEYTVDVIRDGTSTATPVEIGAMGSELTEISSGLAEGDEVVLADLDEAIPSDDADTDSGAGLTGLGGTTGGGSVPAGGTFPGGGAGASFPGGGSQPAR